MKIGNLLLWSFKTKILSRQITSTGWIHNHVLGYVYYVEPTVNGVVSETN